MKRYLHFQPKYLLIALFIFGVEVLIERYFHDGFIRPVVGDFLIVVLMYYSLKSILKISSIKIACGVLLFSFTIEGLQYLQMLKYLGWQDSYWAKIVFGSAFDWRDLLAYTLGVGFALLTDRLIS